MILALSSTTYSSESREMSFLGLSNLGKRVLGKSAQHKWQHLGISGCTLIRSMQIMWNTSGDFLEILNRKTLSTILGYVYQGHQI